MSSSALKIIQDAENRGTMYRFLLVNAIVMVVISVVNLIIGAVFNGQCAIEPNISVYLIVEGITVGIMYSLILSVVSHS